MPSLAKQLVAEFIGTFALVFVGVAVTSFNPGDILSVSLAQGLTIAALASALMAISGAHFNPAVTLGMLVGGRIEVPRALMFILAQLLAGFVAAGLLAFLVSGTELAPKGSGTESKGATEAIAIAVPLFAGWSKLVMASKGATEAIAIAVPKIPNRIINSVPSDEPRINTLQGVVVEATLTFLLVVTYFGTMADGRGPRMGALAVGLAMGSGVLVGYVLTGGALNPARVFGPAAISGTWLNHWIYWVGPLAGGALAGLIYGRFLLEETEQPVKGI